MNVLLLVFLLLSSFYVIFVLILDFVKCFEKVLYVILAL
jgi:hypothetical protein